MSKRAIFWLTAAFLIVVDVVVILLSPMAGLIFLFLLLLAAALLFLFVPHLWSKIGFHRKKKTDDLLETPSAMRTMVLERCDTSSTSPIVISHSPFEIGRSSDCDYVMENMPSIGRHHCRVIYKQETNNFYIEDLGSRNGTYVNSSRLGAHMPTLLRVGSMVAMDKYQYLFKTYGE